MRNNRDQAAEMAALQQASAAKIGALLGSRGFTPDQAAQFQANIQPALDEAWRQVQNGTPPEDIQFAIVPVDDETPDPS